LFSRFCDVRIIFYSGEAGSDEDDDDGAGYIGNVIASMVGGSKIICKLMCLPRVFDTDRI
jgi:hypothetical protein